jgi:hypothetical protein
MTVGRQFLLLPHLLKLAKSDLEIWLVIPTVYTEGLIKVH